MDTHNLIILLALVIPLTIDTFILSGALGLAGMPKNSRLRISLILAAFEAGMPAVGVLIGLALGDLIGQFAGYTAAVIIGLAGVILLRPGNAKKKRRQKMKLLAHARGLAIIDLGIAISIDELAIGLSLGLLGISLWVAAVVIGIQAFLASQAGFYLGGRLSDRMQQGAERVAGAVLILVGLILIAIKATGHQL